MKKESATRTELRKRMPWKLDPKKADRLLQVLFNWYCVCLETDDTNSFDALLAQQSATILLKRETLSAIVSILENN